MCDLCLRETAYTKRGWTGYLTAESLSWCWSRPSSWSCTSLTLSWIQYLKRGMTRRGEKKQNGHVFKLKHFSSAQPCSSMVTVVLSWSMHRAWAGIHHWKGCACLWELFFASVFLPTSLPLAPSSCTTAVRGVRSPPLHPHSVQQSGLQSFWSRHCVNQRAENRKRAGLFCSVAYNTCQKWSGLFLG